MASRTDLARQYMEYQRDQKLAESLALLADDVVMSNPMTGTVTGKAALEQQMRSRPAGGGGGGMNISWSDPEEDGDAVKIVGTGSPFGPIKLVLGFNEADQINKIDIGLA